jgi:hypothetical protein
MNMKQKTIAIAGFSMATFGGLKDTSADEIWTLNHAFAMAEAFPRFDRVFELHKKEWFLRQDYASLDRYEAWLREPHPFPIYMQAVDPEYPASVAYPFEEVSQDIFGKLLRGSERNLYYTSSFSYMLALAIFERVGRIEVYGIDMGNETEYQYQKPSGELMIGVALGRGIEVVLQPECALCKAQLYGYDRVPAASRERCLDLAGMYAREARLAGQEAEVLAAVYNQGGKDPGVLMEKRAYAAMNRGGAQALENLAQSAYFLGRQHLESERHKLRDEEERWLAMTNERHATVKAYDVAGAGELVPDAWREYLEARRQMYFYSGARQAVQKLIDECDMKVVPDAIRMEIVDG